MWHKPHVGTVECTVLCLVSKAIWGFAFEKSNLCVLVVGNGREIQFKWVIVSIGSFSNLSTSNCQSYSPNTLCCVYFHLSRGKIHKLFYFFSTSVQYITSETQYHTGFGFSRDWPQGLRTHRPELGRFRHGAPSRGFAAVSSMTRDVWE
jgi:hypothetical protein